MNEASKVILSYPRFELTINRLCYELIEKHQDFSNTCFIGIQPRGTLFAERIYKSLNQLAEIDSVDKGKLDVTFYRDDVGRRSKPLIPSTNEMNFIVENKDVVLIDDVLYTGRTIRAAMTALLHYGRPKSVELLVLINRRFNRHLPVHPDYIGMTIDAVDEEHVRAEWSEIHGKDQVVLYPRKSSKT